jgi:hypothetical protein
MQFLSPDGRARLPALAAERAKDPEPLQLEILRGDEDN